MTSIWITSHRFISEFLTKLLLTKYFLTKFFPNDYHPHHFYVFVHHFTWSHDTETSIRSACQRLTSCRSWRSLAWTPKPLQASPVVSQRASWLGPVLYGVAITPHTNTRVSRKWWEQQNSSLVINSQPDKTSTDRGASGKHTKSPQTSVIPNTVYSLNCYLGNAFWIIHSHISWLKNSFSLQAIKYDQVTWQTFLLLFLLLPLCNMDTSFLKPYRTDLGSIQCYYNWFLVKRKKMLFW